MSKLIWNTLKLCPVILAATFLIANRTQAAEVPVAEVSSNQATASVSGKSNLIAEIKQLDAKKPLQVAQNVTSQPSQNTVAPNPQAEETSVSQLSNPAPATMAQVTSVSQLSDVQPTDWAFQALQSLVERYGCIAGYPDGTYRGNRALTRYEFAAGLNACLNRVNELIAAASADGIRKEDLATLQRLQEEFAAELATLRGRVDALEAQTAELEANQFSTTTKLSGEVIAAVADVFGDEFAIPSNPVDVTANGAPVQPTGENDIDANTIFADRVRLNFDTSFFGEDLLRVRLQARNITPFGADITGTNMTRLGFDGDNGNDVEIDDFFYRFPVGDVAEVKVNFANAEFNDDVYTFNPLFESSGRGAISRFGRFNPIYRQGDGAGVTVNLNPEGKIGVALSYLAPDSNDPSEGAGLFNGSYAALGQIAFRPSDALQLGLTYVHSYDRPSAGGTGSIFADQPFGDDIVTSANHYGVEINYKLGKLNLGGWGGLSYTTVEDGAVSPFVNTGDSAESFNWAATLGLQDFGKEGSVLGVIFGQPPKLGANTFATGSIREDDDTSYHLEALYRYPLTDNIEITPGVVVLFNPEHNSDNDTIYVGTLRTTFRF